MKLEDAVKGVLDAENNLRSREGINNPSFVSEHMQRLSQYLGSVEEHLAQYEKDYELQQAELLKKYLIELEMPITKAEKMVKIELAVTKGQIAYLSRIVSSGWRQVSTAQSRINHLVAEWNIGSKL